MYTLPKYDSASLYPHHKVLSSSQFLTYLKSPQDFYTRHVLSASVKDDNAKEYKSVPMQIGSIFSAVYADRKFPYREALADCGAPRDVGDRFERALKQLPVINTGHPEYPLKAWCGDWELRATLDDFVESQFTIIENKTGKAIWNQERVNFDQQLTFQAYCHLLKFGIIPRRIMLNWVPTGGSLRNLYQFKTTRSRKALYSFGDLVKLVLQNIDAGNFTQNIY